MSESLGPKFSNTLRTKQRLSQKVSILNSFGEAAIGRPGFFMSVDSWLYHVVILACLRLEVDVFALVDLP